MSNRITIIVWKIANVSKISWQFKNLCLQWRTSMSPRAYTKAFTLHGLFTIATCKRHCCSICRLNPTTARVWTQLWSVFTINYCYFIIRVIVFSFRVIWYKQHPSPKVHDCFFKPLAASRSGPRQYWQIKHNVIHLAPTFALLLLLDFQEVCEWTLGETRWSDSVGVRGDGLWSFGVFFFFFLAAPDCYCSNTCQHTGACLLLHCRFIGANNHRDAEKVQQTKAVYVCRH